MENLRRVNYIGQRRRAAYVGFLAKAETAPQGQAPDAGAGGKAHRRDRGDGLVVGDGYPPAVLRGHGASGGPVRRHSGLPALPPGQALSRHLRFERGGGRARVRHGGAAEEKRRKEVEETLLQ